MPLGNTTPQRSKHKYYTSYREPSHPMAPPAEATAGRVVVPTVETQELYNRWRRAEEGLNEESLRQVQNMHGGHLQPPSPSRATSSRSPSNASTTYSVSHAMGEMDVGDQRSQTGKHKPGRRGPLKPIKQLRANLMRKIGACPDCRERRVGCKNHHILTLFEQAYEAAKQKTDMPINAALHTEPTTPYQTRLGNPADLAGVGGGQSPIGDLPYHLPDSPQAVMDDGLLDFDPLQNTQLNTRPHLAPILSIFPGSQVPVSNPTAQYALIPGPQGPQPVVIGKQFAPMSQLWVCFGGSYASDPSHCGQQFPNLPALEQHFATFHARFYGQYYTWGCINCQYQVSYLSAGNHCVQCQKPSLWEMWYWGTVDSPSGPPSAVPGLSISHGESPSGPSSQTSHSAQHPDPSTTYNNAYLPPSGGYGYGYGGGQSYLCTPTAPTADTKPTCHPCKPLITDMCFFELFPLEDRQQDGISPAGLPSSYYPRRLCYRPPRPRRVPDLKPSPSFRRG